MTRLRFFMFVLLAGLVFSSVPARSETTEAPVASEPAAASVPTPPPRPSENWSVRCDEPKEDTGAKGYCEIFQRLVIKENSQRFSEMAVGYPAGEKKNIARAVLLLPLGVLLEDPVRIEIDGKEFAKAPVRYCQAQGCFLTFTIKDSLVTKMSSGKTLMIKAKAFSGQNLHIEMSLQGFGQAIRKVAPQS